MKTMIGQKQIQRFSSGIYHLLRHRKYFISLRTVKCTRGIQFGSSSADYLDYTKTAGAVRQNPLQIAEGWNFNSVLPGSI